MMSHRPETSVPPREPIPNYGRGAFFGLIAAIVSGAGWALLIAVTEEFNMGLMLAIGWLIGSAVKWGMRAVDRVGLAIALYGTLLSIFIGTFLYIGSIVHDQGGTVTIEGIALTFLNALRDWKFLALYAVFVIGSCWLAVAVCGEGIPNPFRLILRRKGGTEKPPPAKR